MGKDANASLLRDALSDSGVRLDHLKEVDGPSGTAVILLQPSGTTLTPLRLQVVSSTGAEAVVCLIHSDPLTGENSILIVGGANTAAWDFDDAALQVMSFLAFQNCSGD